MKGYTGLVGLDIPKSDFATCTYTGSNLTGVVYRRGGATGKIVATLALTYVGSQLDTVTLT